MPYSASKLGCFDNCKQQFKLKYIDKIKVPQVPKIFFEKGKYIHFALEHWPKIPNTRFKFSLAGDKERKLWKKILTKILNDTAIQTLLLKENVSREETLKISEGFGTEKSSLFRGFVDYYCLNGDQAEILDWKTGKVYNKTESDQLKLYALWILLKYPEINTVDSSLFYVEHSVKTNFIYQRSELENIKQYFINKIQMIESEKDFDLNASWNCQYCDFNGNYCHPHKIKLKRKYHGKVGNTRT